MVVQGRQSINAWHLGNNIFGHSKENLMMHLQRRFGVRNTTSLFVRFFSRPRTSSAVKSLETGELNGKASKDRAAKRKTGNPFAGNGSRQHHVHGWRGIGSQRQSAACWLANATRYDPPGKANRQPFSPHQGVSAAGRPGRSGFRRMGSL